MRWPLIKYLPDKTNFRYVGFARIAAALSVLAVIGSLFLTVYPFRPPCGGLNCGVEFRGGTVMELSSRSGPIDVGRVRSILGAMDLGDVQVQEFGDSRILPARRRSHGGEDGGLRRAALHGDAVEVDQRVMLAHRLRRGGAEDEGHPVFLR